MNYGCQLPSQTHCFPPSRLQALPWSSRGTSVGMIYKALLLIQDSSTLHTGPAFQVGLLALTCWHRQFKMRLPKAWILIYATAEQEMIKVTWKAQWKPWVPGRPRGLCATAEQHRDTASGEGLGRCLWFIMTGSFKGSSLDDALISLTHQFSVLAASLNHLGRL